jgi:hypothetical protein
MRGALLFLATMMVVTPGGRGEIEEFADRTSRLYDAAAPYSTAMLWLTAGMALVIALMLRRAREKERPLLVKTEVSGPIFNGNEERRRTKSRFSWMWRLTHRVK